MLLICGKNRVLDWQVYREYWPHFPKSCRDFSWIP